MAGQSHTNKFSWNSKSLIKISLLSFDEGLLIGVWEGKKFHNTFFFANLSRSFNALLGNLHFVMIWGKSKSYK